MPMEIIGKLEGQVDEILSLYDFGEKLHNYESVHGGRALNENQRRQDMVAFLNQKGQSGRILQGCSLWGFASLYLYSRKGAASIYDLSKVRACGWTSASVFMIGTTLGCMYYMTKERQRLDAAEQNVRTTTRVAQNEQTHALLRSMKYHLTTRQMSVWDQSPK